MHGLKAKYHKIWQKIIKRGIVNSLQILQSRAITFKRGVMLLISEKNENLSYMKTADMTNMPRRRYLERANNLINGKLALDSVFKEEMDYSLENFDWNVSYTNAATTHQLYLQSLNPIGDLSAAFLYTRNKDYFLLAIEFFSSWCSFSKSILSVTNEYIWDHHAAALRAENLSYFLLVGKEKDCFSDKEINMVSDYLIYHGEFLSDIRNYLKNHNHGVYQDRALLYLAVMFGRAEWADTAYSRLRRQWDFLFNDEMVCIENSYTYQRVNVDLFNDIAVFSEKQGHSYGKDLLGKLTIAQDFMGYALMPNGFCAPFGDTFFGDYSGYKAISSEGVMTYAASKGTNGIIPYSRSIVYPKAGYYFGREHWNRENFNDATWTMFRSGYKTITHRQADDNSFMFYAKGHDIFVDSGLYTYMFRDPIRIYTRSANAHNTVIAGETSFCFQREDLTELCGIIHSDISLRNGYDYVVGFNALYLGIFHLRHFAFLENAIFIFDEIESIHEHKFSQLFHCGKDTSVESINTNELCLKIGNSDSVCRVKQLLPIQKIDSINGKDEGAKYGIWSDNFEEYHYINTVKFDNYGKNICYATEITVEPSEEKQIAFDISKRILAFMKDGNLKTVELKKFNKYDIVPAQAFIMDSYEITQDSSILTIANAAKYKQPVQYAYYVISRKTRKPVKQQMYTESPTFIYDFSEVDNGEYSIRAFIMVNKKKASQIICNVTCKDGICSYKRELELDTDWRSLEIERCE